MFKRIGLSMALLAGLVAFAAPRHANAETHFGISIGVAPRAYYPPPAPVYDNGYGYDPYANYYDYPAPAYSYPAPVYVSPYSYGYYGNGWREHERHEWREHERHEEHERREHGGWGRGWRR